MKGKFRIHHLQTYITELHLPLFILSISVMHQKYIWPLHYPTVWKLVTVMFTLFFHQRRLQSLILVSVEKELCTEV